MNRLLTLLLLPLCACVIDGVPLPDENDTTGEPTRPGDAAAGFAGAYVTRTAGATVVFGFEGAVAPAAVIKVASGTVTSSTVPADDGSFNVTLGGDLGSTLVVSVILQGEVTASATLATPVIDQTTQPDNASAVGAGPDDTVTASRVTSSTRVDSGHARIVFAAQSFVAGATVAIANVDQGATERDLAAADGSIDVIVTAARNETLFFSTVVGGTASSPYVVTAP